MQYCRIEEDDNLRISKQILEKFSCPIENCEKQCRNEESLKAHLLFTHNTLSPMCTTKAYFQHIEECDEIRKRYRELKYQLMNSKSHFNNLIKWADNLSKMLNIPLSRKGRWYGDVRHKFRYGQNEYYNKLCVHLNKQGEKIFLMNEALRGIFEEGNKKGIILG